MEKENQKRKKSDRPKWKLKDSELVSDEFSLPGSFASHLQ